MQNHTNRQNRVNPQSEALAPGAAPESRLARGQRMLAMIDGNAGEHVVASLADIAPDFARFFLEFPFGTSTRGQGSTCARARSRPSRRSPRSAMRSRNSRCMSPPG